MPTTRLSGEGPGAGFTRPVPVINAEWAEGMASSIRLGVRTLDFVAKDAQGAVLIEATISKEGSVINPKVLSGDPLLARAAIEAVRQWRYKPYYLDGEPVEIKTQITINFKEN